MTKTNLNVDELQRASSERRFRLFLSTSGIGGCIALIVYFSAPFVLFPFPPAAASSAEIMASATNYQVYYLLAAWLQGTGTLLIVIFVLGLLYSARAWNKFSGWITLLASGAILMLSLNEGSYFIDVAQAAADGHPEAAVASFDLTFVFIHSFFTSPALLLPLAFVLRSSSILPRILWIWDFALGVAFETLGFVGLFVPEVTLPSIALLILMLVWVIYGSLPLVIRGNKFSG